MGGLPLLLRASRLGKQGGSEELFSAAGNDAICLIGHLSQADSNGIWRVARLPFKHDGPAAMLMVPSVSRSHAERAIFARRTPLH